MKERRPNSLLAAVVGNTSVRWGLLVKGRLARKWRCDANAAAVRELSLPDGVADRAVFCSVVPWLNQAVKRRLAKATGCQPVELTSVSRHGLRIAYKEPSRLGVDRIAAVLGARARFGPRAMLVVDCGTATTLTAVSADGKVLGGAILPGLALWTPMLAARTALLPEVEPAKPRSAVGRSPEEAIQAGAWFGHAGAVERLSEEIRLEAFGRRPSVVVVTGGNANRLIEAGFHARREPDLAILGLAAVAFAKRDRLFAKGDRLSKNARKTGAGQKVDSRLS